VEVLQKFNFENYTRFQKNGSKNTRNYSTVSLSRKRFSIRYIHTYIHTMRKVLPGAFAFACACVCNGCAQLRFKFYDLLNLNYTTPIKWDRARCPCDCQVLHSVFQPLSPLAPSPFVPLPTLSPPPILPRHSDGTRCLRLRSKTSNSSSNLVYRQKSARRTLADICTRKTII